MKRNENKVSTSPVMFHIDFNTKKELFNKFGLWKRMERKGKRVKRTTK